MNLHTCSVGSQRGAPCGRRTAVMSEKNQTKCNAKAVGDVDGAHGKAGNKARVVPPPTTVGDYYVDTAPEQHEGRSHGSFTGKRKNLHV